MASNFERESSNYQICSILGQCTSNVGTVYVARHGPSKNLVAVKKYNLENLSNDDIKLVEDEIILMKQLNHLNLIPCLASFVSGQDICSVMPLMGYGSCTDIMARRFGTGLPEPVIASVIYSVLLALHYLHKKFIIHRAVRASHILISANGNVKLSGLRYAGYLYKYGLLQRKIHSFPESTLPNLNWLSPELLNQNLDGYDEKSDIYSVGVTACELANGIVPFCHMPATLMLTEKVSGQSPQLLDCTTFETFPNEEDDIDGRAVEYSNAISSRRFSEYFHSVVEECLERLPNSRPSATQLMQNRHFFKHAPPNSALPKLLEPVVPISDQNLPIIQDDLESMLAAEKFSNLKINSINWDF